MNAEASFKPKARTDVLQQASPEGCLLLDQATERVHSLNRTAAFVWTYCDGNHNLAEITSALTLSWKGPMKDLCAEVKETVEKFRALGLLES